MRRTVLRRVRGRPFPAMRQSKRPAKQDQVSKLRQSRSRSIRRDCSGAVSGSRTATGCTGRRLDASRSHRPSPPAQSRAAPTHFSRDFFGWRFVRAANHRVLWGASRSVEEQIADEQDKVRIPFDRPADSVQWMSPELLGHRLLRRVRGQIDQEESLAQVIEAPAHVRPCGRRPGLDGSNASPA